MSKDEILKHQFLDNIDKYNTILNKLDNNYTLGIPLELSGVEILKLRSLVNGTLLRYGHLLDDLERRNEFDTGYQE